MRTALLRWTGSIACCSCSGRGVRETVHVHLLVASATDGGFQWDPHTPGWIRPGLPVLSNLAGPIQHFRLLFFMLGEGKVTADLLCLGGI